MEIHVFSEFTEFDRTVNKFSFKSKYFNVAVVYVDMKEVGSIFGNFENQDVLIIQRKDLFQSANSCCMAHRI